MRTKNDQSCHVVIVTHNSQPYLAKCLQSLKQQTRQPEGIFLIDSGSQQTDYLLPYAKDPQFIVDLHAQNIGFCQGNNRGFALIPKNCNYVLFLNPDAFLTPTFIEHAINFMELPQNGSVGALSGILLGYDICKEHPTGTIDSTGIFQTWYGRWYDRDQGSNGSLNVYSKCEEVPALCGALMFCRKEALDSVQLKPFEVMDPKFYMYKEDIDLSLRLKRRGWSLIFNPQLVAYHCRGWQNDRTKVPRRFRLMSAKNEMRVHFRAFSPYWFYSAFKYTLVKVFDV